MRGDTERQANILLAVTPDSFIPDDHPIPPHQADRRCGADEALALFGTMYSRWAPLDPARAPAQGEPADRALRSAVSVSSASGCATTCSSNGSSTSTSQTSRSTPPASRRTVSACSPTTWRAPSSARWWPRRSAGGCSPSSIHGGRHAARGMGLAQELPPARRAGSAGRRAQPGRGLPGTAPQPRHACLATDPEARLYTKGPGQTAKLNYMGHLLTENRHGLVLDVELTEANGHAEREAALAMVERSAGGRATLGADRGYDVRGFVAALRARGVTPHVAQNDRRPPQRRGRPHHAARRLRGEPAAAQARGGGLRLDEDRGRRPQAALPGPRAQPCLAGVHGRGLQPRAHGQIRGRRGVGTVRPAPPSGRSQAARGPLSGRLGGNHHDAIEQTRPDPCP